MWTEWSWGTHVEVLRKTTKRQPIPGQIIEWKPTEHEAKSPSTQHNSSNGGGGGSSSSSSSSSSNKLSGTTVLSIVYVSLIRRLIAAEN
jgi:hypothetical protein